MYVKVVLFFRVCSQPTKKQLQPCTSVTCLTSVLEGQTSNQLVSWLYEKQQRWGRDLYPSTKVNRLLCFGALLLHKPISTKPNGVCRITRSTTEYLPSYWQSLLEDLFRLDPLPEHSVSLEYGQYLERYYLLQEENRISFAMVLWGQ